VAQQGADVAACAPARASRRRDDHAGGGRLTMRIVQRYLGREILLAVALVLGALLVLYTSFDFINEINDVGKNGYRIDQAALFVLLQVPARAYELLPIGALIGTIYALAQLASHSEFTILRVAGLSTGGAVRLVMTPGLVLVVLTALLGELVTPRVEAFTQNLMLKPGAGPVARGFRSGLWVKDNARQRDGHILTRYVNIASVDTDNVLHDVRIYEYDDTQRLKDIAIATRASFVPPHAWMLADVSDTRFVDLGGSLAPDRVEVTRVPQRLWESELSPQLLQVLTVSPERMAARNLETYIRHLEDNKQTSDRYQIAFWKKIIYPFAVLVMMALALPFAYLHFRSGGISFKIFAGIMLGIGFYLLNNLFSRVGLLNTWPPFLSAAMPSMLALAGALGALRWVERR
jgi:lipopolysaccharide export system permease protein